MAADVTYNAIADLIELGQKPTLERIASLSGRTMAQTVTSLKANKARLHMGSDKILLLPNAVDTWV